MLWVLAQSWDMMQNNNLKKNFREKSAKKVKLFHVGVRFHRIIVHPSYQSCGISDYISCHVEVFSRSDTDLRCCMIWNFKTLDPKTYSSLKPCGSPKHQLFMGVEKKAFLAKENVPGTQALCKNEAGWCVFRHVQTAKLYNSFFERLPPNVGQETCSS